MKQSKRRQIIDYKILSGIMKKKYTRERVYIVNYI